MYVTYELVREKDNILIFKYYPCDSNNSGEVWFNPITNEYGLIHLEPNDKYKRFALMMFSAIRRMISQHKIEKKGMLACG